MGRHVVITGASSGIGAALAMELGARGYAVGLVARRKDKLDEVAARVRAAAGEVAIAAADVADAEALEAAIRSLEAELGPCEVLVANAGRGGPFDARVCDPEPVRSLFDVNFFGAVNAVHAVVPGMVERRRGLLVAISSVSANRGLPRSGPYSASKAALSIFWESLRLDLGPSGVRCLTVHPGFVRTPIHKGQDFQKPFMVGAEQAARRIADAMGAGSTALTFPWQMRFVEWLMRRVPNALFDRLLRGRR